jgi:hypothetical protein
MRLHLLAFTGLFLLASCGGDGDGMPSLPVTGQVASPGPSRDPLDLGRRALPGYEVGIRQLGPAQAGSPLTITASIIPESGLAQAVLVEAALGAEEPATWTAGTAIDDGTWAWTGSLPADLAGQRAWLRVTDADGNVSQSGAQDFRLAP